MEQDRNSYMCSPTTMSTFDESSPTTMSTFDESSTQLASGDDVSINFVESGGARPKIIDDSPLQNQIQRNKECKNRLKQRSRFLIESKLRTIANPFKDALIYGIS